MGSNLPRLTKRSLPKGPRTLLEATETKNVACVLDFMHDTLCCGKLFGTLNLIEEASRQALVSRSIPTCQLLGLFRSWNRRRMRLDDGLLLRSTALTEWCTDRGIDLRDIQLGAPSQNPFIERFN